MGAPRSRRCERARKAAHGRYRTTQYLGQRRYPGIMRRHERAYLGEYWEYVVRPAESDLRLRVSASPQTVYNTDDAVWLEIDPRRITRIPSEG